MKPADRQLVGVRSSFGKRLAAIRGTTPQEQFAASVGLSRAALSHYENGRREPTLETLAAISDRYSVSFDYLVKGRS